MEASDVFSQIQPFTGGNLPAPHESAAVLADVAAQREIAQVQAAMTIAKRFPRNQKKAMDRIMVACQRPGLAEKALYSYARGGTDITGPSIRLAEAIAQNWGNLEFGIRELEQRAGESTVEAYAWDLETNTRQAKTFQVRHFRYRKGGSGYNLQDPRDIYELVANQGARRLRACILGVIPGDVVEAAQEECEKTLKTKADISSETIQKLVKAFEGFTVTRSMLETRIQRNLDAITSAQVIALRKIFNSLRDGMSKPEDWFDEPVCEPEMQPEKPKKGRPRKTSEKPQEAPAEGTMAKVQESPQEAANGAVKPPRAISEEQLSIILEGIAGGRIDERETLDLYDVSALEELDRAAANSIIDRINE